MTHEEAEALAREISAEIAQSPILRTVVEFTQVEECPRTIAPETMDEPPTWCVRVTGLDDNRFGQLIPNRSEWERVKAGLLERWPDGIRR